MSDKDKKPDTKSNIFAPEWAKDLGAKAGEALRSIVPSSVRQAGGDAIHYAAEAMSPDRAQERQARYTPEAAKPAVAKAVQVANHYMTPEPTQDEKLETIKQQVRDAQRAVDQLNGVRQPVQQERGFSNDEDRQKYIQQKAIEASRKVR